jgi:hypothetical protein
MNNILKDPDFLFTLLAAVMKRQGEGKLEISEEDIMAVDMTEAVGLQYDRESGLITLKFISAEELAERTSTTEQADPPRLRLVPEFEDE